MSEQVLKPPQERGKQNYSERGLGQAAPTQLFFFFFWHEWLPDTGSTVPGPQLSCPPWSPSRKVRPEASLTTQERG